MDIELSMLLSLVAVVRQPLVPSICLLYLMEPTVLLTLRIYALYHRSFRILAYMIDSGIVLLVIAVWAIFGQKGARERPPQEIAGCHIGISRITSIRTATAWEGLFVYDSIIFGLTMFKTWKNRVQSMSSQTPNSFIYLLFRDGAIYFAVMALANLANILTFYFCGPFMSNGLTALASDLSVTMMSRLMLNLHEHANVEIFSTTHAISTYMEYLSPTTEIELDTIGTCDMNHSIISPVQNDRLGEDNTTANPALSSPPLTLTAV
ncbi:hypothetical protein J132_07659 [Termitomyces sp. J132]|nr:hypothetical protein J132_07659 [Termitomyces sp. J132]